MAAPSRSFVHSLVRSFVPSFVPSFVASFVASFGTLAAVAMLAGACAGNAPSSEGRPCQGALYDKCLDEHQCMSGNCHSFLTEGFEICTTSCTAGDDAPCAVAGGQKGTCNSAGLCVAPAPNACEPL